MENEKQPEESGQDMQMSQFSMVLSIMFVTLVFILLFVKIVFY